MCSAEPAPRVMPTAHHRYRDAEGCRTGWRSLLAGRRGWFAVELPARVTPVFLWTHDGTTYCADMGLHPSRRQQSTFRLSGLPGLPAALTPLASWADDVCVSGVHELVVAVDTSRAPGHFVVKHAWPLTAPLRERRAGAKAKDDDEDSCDSWGSRDERLEVRSDDSAGVPEVETDLDAGVDDAPADSHRKCHVSSDSEEHGEAEPLAADVAKAAVGAFEAGSAVALEPGSRRHAPGTWKVWESLWFYMTQDPSFDDIKVWVKVCLREGEGGMRTPPQMSRTLTPAHYGEDKSDCPRTKLLLRCWCVWRARQHGWSDATPSRQRELSHFIAALREDFVALHAPGPGHLFGVVKAQKLASGWFPEICAP